ncbi:hypothetical protein [Pseudanabaena sp. FACHB-2040]|uniref:hypothetical protein n=1 Tax=Pseudanabaena sp. FACHB-2040 TaxID=2692859 RepID=UPI0016820ECC|nr:hypothetical protein [Pseudanabaena sp. FACHB-2040]MBD2258001.1 hypothetical protein [Pseudanabaena sp. FACHB-2040]
MVENPQSRIRLELELSPDQSGLLAGLEAWLALGLISEEQVRDLCQSRLVCALPPVPVVQASGPESESDFAGLGADWPADDEVTAPSAEPSSEPLRGFLPPEAQPQGRPNRGRERGERPAPRVRHSQPVNIWLQQLMGELSVVWLLGLGVFLVVLSSAVLAATQWGQFNTVGQYLILLAYTAVFWAIGLWSTTHARLQLTSKTLQIMSLLLVPLNGWAIDALRVGRTGGGLLVSVIALLLLSLMALQVLRRLSAPLVQGVCFLGLAYLHLGWSLPWVPLLAAYVGATGSALATLSDPRVAVSDRRSVRLPLLLVIFALGLLLLRSLTVFPSDQWGQLGLAFGLYGASLVWLGLRHWGAPPAPDVAGAEGANSSPSQPRLPLAQWSLWGGRALLWWGWLLALAQWPAQALGVSILGLGLRLLQLRQGGRRWDLVAAFAIALHIPFLVWELVPLALQTRLVMPLTNLTGTAENPDLLLGITLFPYVVLMVGVADTFYRSSRRPLGAASEGIAVGLGGALTLLSSFDSTVLVLNLIASSMTALTATLRRQPLQPWRVYATNALALLTVAVIVADRWPALSPSRWTAVVFSLMAAELLLSRGRRNLWQESAWTLGRLLAGLAYLLLLERLIEVNFQTRLSLLGLSIPLVLLLVRGYSGSVLALGLTAPLTLGLPLTRLVGLGTATILAGVNSRFRQELGVAMLTLGFALGWVVSLLHDGVPGLLPDNTYWYLVGAVVTLVLWLAWRRLSAVELEPVPESWQGLYGIACDRWGFILSGVVLLGLTVESGLLYSDLRPAYLTYALALLGLIGALFCRFWRQPQPLAVYSLGWATVLLLAEGLRWQDGTRLTLAIAVLALGGLTLALGYGLRSRLPALLPALHHLGLAYALLSLGLRTGYFTAWSGWLTLAASLIALEVGRQRRPWLRWLGLVGISLGWYELVVYRLSQASGGYAADGLVMLAGVALLLMGIYRLSAGRVEQHLRLPQRELRVAAHAHWVVGSVLMLLSAASALISGGPGLPWLALAIGLGFVLYALWQGRFPAAADIQPLWIYLGLVELVGWIAYLRLAFYRLVFLDPWWGVVACGLAVAFYWLPWHRWGWPQRPWRVTAVILPLATLIITGGLNHVPSLWITAGFYGWLAWSSRRVRLSYLSVGLGIWAIWYWLWERSISDGLAQVGPCGLALLYAAQVDPALQSDEHREARHWFRVMGLGIILVVALFSERWTGLPVGVGSLGAIALGLLLRTRAFLYIGTVIFGLNAINQLVLLNATYPFIKWVIGIVVGVALIWIAADFERRRDQWLILTQGWVQELDRWS